MYDNTQEAKLKSIGKIKRYRGKVKRFNAKSKSIRAKCNCIALGYYLDDGIMTLDSVSENKKKLRTGNLIELTLDLDEGMSNTEALKAIALSRTAESEASKNFSDYQDCAQHFIWNFKMTSSLSKTKARTVGTNHEWGISLINPLERYFDEAYENYLSDGYSSDEASNKAFTDTVFNIPAFKYETVLLLQSSYSFFTSFFTDECIMDFWNNCYGRSYVEKGYSDGVSAFRAALNANELVLDGIPMAANLTQTQKRNVWSWDWYSY